MILEIANNYEKTGSAYSALYRAVDIYEYYLPRIWRLNNPKNFRLWKIGSRYLQALDDACVLGYAWARAEAELRMKPLALAALASKAGASRAGQASGARRRANAAETWQAAVKAEACRLRGEQPHISQSKLATEILYQLGDDALPSHAIMVRYISKLERDGELPKRHK
jgi:hypothetical protein